MVGETHQNVFFIQIDASSFAEFEISEFEIARVDYSFIVDFKSSQGRNYASQVLEMGRLTAVLHKCQHCNVYM